MIWHFMYALQFLGCASLGEAASDRKYISIVNIELEKYFALTLNLELLYFLRLCPTFVGPSLCQFEKEKYFY